MSRARIAVLLRHLRAERAMVATLFVVICVTSFLMAAAPRLYNQVLDDELRARLVAAPPSQRNIAVSVLYRFELPQSQDITNRMDESAAAYQNELAPELQDVINAREYIIQPPDLTVLKNATSPEPAIARGLRLRYQSGIDDHIEYIAGAPPSERRSIDVSGMSEWYPDNDTVNLPVTEIAMSEETAAGFGLDVGDVAVIRQDANGAIWAVYLAGIFRVLDRDDAFWNDDGALASPSIVGYGTDFGEMLIGDALMPPAAHRQVLDLIYPQRARYTWTYYVDPNRLDSANYPDVVAEARKLLATQGPYEELANTNADQFAIHNDLGGILDRFRASSQFALSIMALMTIGVLATALTSVAVLAALIADRRTTMIALIRSRGAGPESLLLAQVVEGFLICVPAALLGWLLAIVLIDARPSTWSIWGAAITAGCAVVLLLVAARGNILTQLGQLLGRGDPSSRHSGRRRITAEAVIVLLAVAGIVLLRRRGLAPSQDANFDPALAAVPVLLALAVGMAALRLFPLLMRAAARVIARGRGVVLFVGMRSSAGRSLTTQLPLLVMLLAIGIACFAAVVYRTLDNAQHDASWLDVGADFRIETTQVDALDLTKIDGVTGTAAARTLPIPDGTLIAIDAAGYSNITSGTYGDAHIPPALRTGAHAGTEADPLPVIASPEWLDTDDPQALLGQTVSISLAGETGQAEIYLHIEEIRDQFRAFPEFTSFVVAPLASLQAAAPDSDLYPMTLFVAGPSANLSTIESVAGTQATEASRTGRADRSVEVFSCAERYHELAGAPLVRGVNTSLLLGAIVGGLYSVLAVVSALILSSRSRARDVGYLRTLGLSSRQTVGLTAVEYFPLVLIASVLGLGFGIGVARLTEPGINLGAFIGPDYGVALRIIWWEIGIVPAGLALATCLAVAGFAFVARRLHLGQVTRIGDS